MEPRKGEGAERERENVCVNHLKVVQCKWGDMFAVRFPLPIVFFGL